MIEETQAYDAFYKWFDYLDLNKIPLFAYVIMPNHFHGIIHVPENSPKSISIIISNAKRFLSYDIVKRLRADNKESILDILRQNVSASDKNKHQKHRVFQFSFDCKEVFDTNMLQTKLDYIHKNPCNGKWCLADNYLNYPHSSVQFYERNETNTHIKNYVEYF